MEPREALIRLGGVAPAGAITALVTRRALADAVRKGAVVKDGHGRYSLRSTDDSVRAANALSGVVSHHTAALLWGWELKNDPHLHVTVPRSRRVPEERRRGVRVHWGDLTPQEVTAPGITSRARTILDCLTTSPFDEGLAVADSALRCEAFSRATLLGLTRALRGPGSATARKVAAFADGRAANPFESVLRAIAIDANLDVEPQRVRADLLRANEHAQPARTRRSPRR